MDFFPPNKEQQEFLDTIPKEYAAMWRAIRPPFECDFSGTPDDIGVLSYIEYEAGHHPQGLLGASILWGNVLVATGAVHWVVNKAGDFFLKNPEDCTPYLIWPYARTLEVDNQFFPQDETYITLFQKAFVDLVMCVPGDENEKRLQALYDTADCWWKGMSRELITAIGPKATQQILDEEF